MPQMADFYQSCYNINLDPTMSCNQVEENVEDELQLSRRLRQFHNSTQPYRFIDYLNEKHHQFQNHRSDNGSQRRVKQQRQSVAEMGEALQIRKQYSIDEKSTLCTFEQTLDPEELRSGKPANNRKKLTIQKKQSETDPLHGLGLTRLKSGEVIFGNWVNGSVVGQAKIMYPSGHIYIGEVVNNVRHGKGLFIFKNGHRYEGNFVKGTFEGYGVLMDIFKEVISRGIWSRGKLVQSIL